MASTKSVPHVRAASRLAAAAAAPANTELKAAASALRKPGSSEAASAHNAHVTAGMTAKQTKAYALKQRADEARIQQLRGVFAAYDEDRDGLLNEVELASAMLALGLEPSPKQLSSYQVRAPQAGGVDLATFVKVSMSRASPLPGGPPLEPCDTSYGAIMDLFAAYDTGRSGKVPLALLLHVLAEIAAPTALSMVEVQDLLRMSGILTPEVSADPRLLYAMEVDYRDFVRLMSFVPTAPLPRGKVR